MRRMVTPTLILVTMLFLLSGCTRDRAEAEPTATPTVSSVLPAPADPQVIQSSVLPTATPVPAPTATPVPEREIMAYTVKEGDILSVLAETYNTSADDIRALNFLTDDNIQVGAILRIPLGPGATAEGIPTPTPAPFEYTVQSGDSLYSIAVNFGVSATAIVAANNLADQNALFVGQTLVIPGYQPAPAVGVTSSGGAANTTTASVIHTVKAGEGLYQIARDYNVSAQAIVDANSIANPNLIKPGQELVIPGAQVPAGVSGQRVHTISSGETLSGIATEYGITMDALMQANGIADPDRILVGQVLTIP
ncbi:MAG: LysM peptidoglycan-binding domain-containing protein [Caldilineaceae bacterium]